MPFFFKFWSTTLLCSLFSCWEGMRNYMGCWWSPDVHGLLYCARQGSSVSRFVSKYFLDYLSNCWTNWSVIWVYFQVFRVSKFISHHARFRSTMVSGGGRLRPQEDSLNSPIDMVVGTPGRVLQHVEEGNLVYGDIRHLVISPVSLVISLTFTEQILFHCWKFYCFNF